MAEDKKAPEMGNGTDTETVEETESQSRPPETGKPVEAQIADMQAALRKANAEAAKYRKQVEAVEKAENERRDAELSEAEKLRKRLAEVEAEAAKLKRAEMQRQAAEKYKLPAVLATRLQGETLEEMEADAEALSKTLLKPQPPAVPPTNPGGSSTTNTETDAQRHARIYGSGADLFNSTEAEKFGGGIILSSKGSKE